MTMKTLSELERLNRAGKHDAEIAELLGFSGTTVQHWRIYLGLPKVEGYRRNVKEYAVYDGETEVLVALGTSEECARALGVTPASLRSYMARAKRGAYQKYSFCEMEEVRADEPDQMKMEGNSRA